MKRYIRAATEASKPTFDQLAKWVADDFNKTMKEENFDSFNDMRKSYMWDMQDVKNEVNDIISQISKDKYDHRRYSDFFMFDDGSAVQIGIDDISWGQFKKLMFKYMKEK